MTTPIHDAMKITISVITRSPSPPLRTRGWAHSSATLYALPDVPRTTDAVRGMCGRWNATEEVDNFEEVTNRGMRTLAPFEDRPKISPRRCLAKSFFSFSFTTIRHLSCQPRLSPSSEPWRVVGEKPSRGRNVELFRKSL